MAVFYLDTSAILKRHRTEKGTLVVTELYENRPQRDVLLTSHFSCLEFESVAARALKGTLLSQEAYDAMLGSFARDLAECLTLVEFSGKTVNDAVNVVRQYALKAADAVQAASAAEAAAALPVTWTMGQGGLVAKRGEVVFVASDKELLSATRAGGMTTLDPEAEDAMDQLRSLRSAGLK